MPEQRLSLPRLGSLGAIVRALPAASPAPKPRFRETIYLHRASYSPAMLLTTAHQVVDAIERRLRLRS
ncbi:MAG: hypothetical protein ABSF68_12910 [Candidatus Acidiferrales bacterium]